MDHFQSIPREQRAEPFVKWQGGKKRLLPAYDALFPSHFEMYHEPFLGGGAVFLYLRHVGRVDRALLSDLNGELIHLYRIIRDEVEALILELEQYPYEKEFYYAVRDKLPEDLDPVKQAARMLYLNRTCFNGLYRVNKQGKFNVPIGRYDTPVVCNASNLRNVSRLLQGVELQRWGYETIVDMARPGDFVYLDPPYQPLTVAGTGDPEAFNESQQGKLHEIFRLLDRRGCLVMLSNSATREVRHLYRSWDMKEIAAHRGAAKRRGRHVELVIRNYA